VIELFKSNTNITHFVNSENKNRKLKILYVSVEVDPFSRTGGLADVARFLPKSLNEKLVDIRVITPLFSKISKINFKILKLVQNQYIDEKVYEYTIYKGFNEEFILYFIKNNYYFGRDNIYGYKDEAERFIFFSKIVLEAIFFLNFKPDIIHFNDWHPAFIPFFLKRDYFKKNFYKNIKTIFTIHCFGYQGLFEKNTIKKLLGINQEEFLEYDIEYNGKISFLKTGLKYSNLINTVSVNHAKELREPIFNITGRSDVIGITNGIDFDEFNPLTDISIYSNYNSESIDKKFINKKFLQKHLGLTENINIPIIAMISRLDVYKGFDLVKNSYHKLLENNIQLIIMGDGNKKIKDMCIKIEKEYPNKAKYINYNKKFSKKIFAGSDMFLMPSHFEACGTTQLIGMRYATIPIARLTGGIIDTVKEFNIKSKSGWGFLFKNLTTEDMLKTINKALNFYENKKLWKIIMINAMKSTKSWKKVSGEYFNLYKTITEK
jgi:starch synthase